MCPQNSSAQLLGNVGTEFYFSFPPCYEVGGPSYIRVYVTAEFGALVKVTVQGYELTKLVLPNTTAEFDLPVPLAQVVSFSGREAAPPEAVYSGSGVHVTSSAPVAVYGVTRFPFTSDAFLAIPVSALGTEYVLSSYPDMSGMYPGLKLPSVTTITAAFDNTEVVFRVGGNAETVTSGGKVSGDTIVRVLNAGDVLLVASDSEDGDLSGSRISASLPVAVTSGNVCANVPTTMRWCDYISEMDLPMHTWGTTYLVSKVINRKVTSVIRIYAREDNTDWYVNGQYMGTITTGGGGEIDEAYVEYSHQGPATNLVVSANKRIYVVQYNQGAEVDNVHLDPFQLVLTPYEQFQNEIVFDTPGSPHKTGFANNLLNLVYELTPNNTIPDDLEFGRQVGGLIIWQKVSAVFGPSIGDTFAVPVNGKNYACKIIQLPGDGAYKIRANTGFAAYLIGFSDYDSYAAPASLMLVDLSANDTTSPLVTLHEQFDGTVSGTVTDISSDASLLARVFLDPAASENYRLDVERFVPGKASSAAWELTVVDPSKDAKAKLTFVDRRGNDTSIAVSYQASLSGVAGLEHGDRISVSPNPASSSIWITTNEAAGGIDRLLLLNLLGEAVLQQPMNGRSETVLDLSMLPPGAYTLQIEQAGVMTHRRVVISR